MGNADVSVPASKAVLCSQTYSGQLVLTNSGQFPIAVDDSSGVNAISNDFTLRPGQSIAWLPGKPVWAICTVAGQTSTLSVAANVSAFNASSGAFTQTLLNATPLQVPPVTTWPTGTLTVGPIDVRQYQTVRFTLSGSIASVSTWTPVLTAKWSNYDQNGVLQPAGTNDVYTCNQYTSIQSWQGVDATLDVRGDAVTFTIGVSTAPNTPLVRVVGYSARKPPLAYEFANPANTVQLPAGRSYTFTDTAVAVGFAGTTLNLPLWSGRILGEVTLTYSGTPTAGAIAALGSAITAPAVTVTQDPLQPLRYRGVFDFASDRNPVVAQIQTGAGYTSVTGVWRFVFHGNEDL